MLCNKVGLARGADELGVRTVVACEVIKLAPVDAPERLGRSSRGVST